jgi:hypothetical protein
MQFKRKSGEERKIILSGRKKEEDVIYTAVFKGLTNRKIGCHYGGQAIYETLGELEGIKVEWIESLEFSNLSFYDVVVVPNIGTTPNTLFSNLKEGWEKEIRKYVENGGGVLLVHHAIGFSRTSKDDFLFPEVGKGINWVPLRTVKITKTHPVTTGESIRKRFPDKAENPIYAQLLRETELSVGDEFVMGFADYIKIAPGREGTVLARSVFDTSGVGDDPVLVVGKAGKGKVVLSGTAVGAAMGPMKEGEKYNFIEKVTSGERKILINSVYWLGEK